MKPTSYETKRLRKEAGARGLQLLFQGDKLILATKEFEEVVFETEDWFEIAEVLGIRDIYYNEDNIEELHKNDMLSTDEINELLSKLIVSVCEYKKRFATSNIPQEKHLLRSNLKRDIAGVKIALDALNEELEVIEKTDFPEASVEDVLELTMHRRMRELEEKLEDIDKKD